MINQLTGYLHKFIQRVEKPQTYGSDLERYIVSHQPQSIYDVEQLTKQYDTKLSQGIFK